MTEAYPIPDFLRQPVEAPRERPILFSSPMVRAILAGSKSQTRRVVKPSLSEREWVEQRDGGGFWRCADGDPTCYTGVWETNEYAQQYPILCPYGQPGDRLWVREKCQAYELPSGLDGVRYLADDSFTPIENSEEAAERWGELACYGMKKSGRPECRKVPSIHMPRWASRILLEIVSVRVERLNEISESDAIAEGISEVPFRPDDGFPLCNGYMVGEDDGKTPLHVSAKAAYHELWEQINGAGSWEANPWVWVVEFQRINP